jgi:hypothetical protein
MDANRSTLFDSTSKLAGEALARTESSFADRAAAKMIERIQIAMLEYSTSPEYQSLFLDIVIEELQRQRRELWPEKKGRRHFDP